MSRKEPRPVWWAVQRSYHYDTHDADGKLVSTETEDEWKARILKEWAYDNPAINADFVCRIFHGRDVEPQTGNPKGLHAHALVHLKDGKTQTAMMAAMGPAAAPAEAPAGGGSTESSDWESSITKNARERVANSTAPA